MCYRCGFAQDQDVENCTIYYGWRIYTFSEVTGLVYIEVYPFCETCHQHYMQYMRSQGYVANTEKDLYVHFAFHTHKLTYRNCVLIDMEETSDYMFTDVSFFASTPKELSKKEEELVEIMSRGPHVHYRRSTDRDLLYFWKFGVNPLKLNRTPQCA